MYIVIVIYIGFCNCIHYTYFYDKNEIGNGRFKKLQNMRIMDYNNGIVGSAYI